MILVWNTNEKKAKKLTQFKTLKVLKYFHKNFLGTCDNMWEHVNNDSLFEYQKTLILTFIKTNFQIWKWYYIIHQHDKLRLMLASTVKLDICKNSKR